MHSATTTVDNQKLSQNVKEANNNGDKTPFSEQNLTDSGNAERFVRLNQNRVKYVPEWGYIIWDGKKWQPDKADKVKQYAVETAKSIFDEAKSAETSYEIKSLSSWGNRSLSLSRLKAMIELAKSYDGIVATADEFDQNPHLLNLENGVLDLRTGTFYAHQPWLMLSKMSPVRYEPEATCPRWEQFLNEVTGNDVELVEYLRRAVGYTLTGSQAEQVFFYLYGLGNNGKTRFLEVIEALLGEYAINAHAQTLLQKKYNNSHSEEIARLRGCRFIVASEMPRGENLNEVLIKDMTGGNTIAARTLYKETAEFKAVGKIWMQGNYRPAVTGVDNGIWRRMRIIEFSQQIPDEKRDKNLLDKLKMELPGILNWALLGAQRWYLSGLQEPESVRIANSDYRTENDPLGRFLNEHCVTGRLEKQPAQALHDAYNRWLEENSLEPATVEFVAKQLKSRGFYSQRSKRGNYWKGLRLIDEAKLTE